jgi:hypothetical protein
VRRRIAIFNYPMEDIWIALKKSEERPTVSRAHFHESVATLAMRRNDTTLDEPTTVFLIIGGFSERVGYYSRGVHGGPAAHKASVLVTIVEWPERRAVGVWTVSADPPERIVRRTSQMSWGAYGDFEQAVAQWIAGLPRAQ